MSSINRSAVKQVMKTLSIVLKSLKLQAKRMLFKHSQTHQLRGATVSLKMAQHSVEVITPRTRGASEEGSQTAVYANCQRRKLIKVLCFSKTFSLEN